MGVVLLVGSAATVTYTLWWIFGDYLLRSPLDNLPGPAPSLFTFGWSLLKLRKATLTRRRTTYLDVGEAAVRQAWKFWANHAKTYGGVSLIYGLLGVSSNERANRISDWLDVWMYSRSLDRGAFWCYTILKHSIQ